MAQRFWMIDFCKRRRITAIDKVVEISAPFDTNEPSIVTGASLGCNPVISHNPAGSGFVVSRVKHDTGEVIGSFVPSATEDLLNNPGGTAWIHGHSGQILEGNLSVTLPVAQMERNYVASIQGTPWLQDVVPGAGLGTSGGVPSGNRAEFGGDLGIKRTCVVASGQEFEVGTRIKHLHNIKHYVKIASVGDNSIPLTLLATNGSSPWRWPGAHNPSSVKQASGFVAVIPGFSWDLKLRLWLVHPAIIGHQGLSLTDSAVHGSLDRRYSIIPWDDITTPDFGGSISNTLNLSPRRSALHIYGSFIEEGASFADMRLLINEVDVTDNFNATSLPSPQFSGSGFLFPNETYNLLYTADVDTVHQYVIAVSSPDHVPNGFPNPFPVATLVFGATSGPGFFVEGTCRFLRAKPNV